MKVRFLMKLKKLWINGYKNLNDFELNFADNDSVTVLIGNNGSGKSNVLEAISKILIKLYSRNYKVEFDYSLEYEIDDKNISIKQFEGENTFKINDEESYSFYVHKDYLPSKIITFYSGENERLLDIYLNEYQKIYYARNKIFNHTVPFMYIDMSDLDIQVLLSLYVKIYEFKTNDDEEALQKFRDENRELKIEIELKKYQKKLVKNQSLVRFLMAISSGSRYVTIESLESFYDSKFPNTKEDFLAVMFNCKIRELANIKFKERSLSEGQIKLRLLELILDIALEKNSLILLDEPDSHIHVANQRNIKELIDKMQHVKHETIIATHSPTLMNIFDRHLEYLENGEVKGKEKAEILKEISGDTMSDAQRQILLNANTDILIVEGKTDEKYISTALEKLKQDNMQYQDLEFNYLYMGGSDPENLKNLVEQFPPKDNQAIIAFFDNDGAGYKCITKAFNYTAERQDFTRKNENGIHICLYPKKNGFTKSEFEIEDYFKIETCRDFMFSNFETFQDTKKKFKKNDFAEYCPDLNADEFDGFKTLFDFILDIKESNNANTNT